MVKLSSEFNELKRLSAKVGCDLTLTQGAGGNTSLKQDGVLWVKASGKWLSNAEEEQMFLPVDLLGARSEAGTATPLIDTPLRASIETSFHALLPQRVVVHVHSVNTLAWAVQRDGEQKLFALLAGLRWTWIPYIRPGLPLTKLMRQRLAENPEVWVLANHGLIVAADTVAEAEALLYEVERRLAIVPDHLPSDEAALAPYCRDGQWKLPKHAVAHQAALTDDRVRRAAQGSMYPDQTVFIGPACATISSGLTRYSEQWRMDAKALLVPGAGLLIAADASAGAEEMVACLGLVLQRLQHSSDVVFLDHEEVYGLMNWDAEKYRQGLTRN